MRAAAMTVSERSQQSMDHAIEAALQQTMLTWGEAGGVLTRLDGPRALTLSRVVMVSITSYTLRALSFMHFADGPGMRQHVAGLLNRPVAEVTESDVLDQICERANLLSGALNRNLVHHFPHLGMSTPSLLDRPCVDRVSVLRPGYDVHFALEYPGDWRLGFSLFLCTSAPIDFVIEAENDAVAGELELL